VTKTAILLGAWRATVSKVMSEYTNHGKTTSAKGNSGRKSTLTERARHISIRIVSKNQRITAAKATAEMNIHLEDPISIKTLRHELDRSNMHGRATIA
jgi:hypothetical protein